MSVELPAYGIVSPSNSTRLADLGRELLDMSTSIVAALQSFDYNGADPNLVLSRVADLESSVEDLESEVTTPTVVDIAASLTGLSAFWDISNAKIVRQGYLRQLYIRFSRTGSAVSVGTVGNVANIDLATLPPIDRPMLAAMLHTAAVGRLAAGSAGTDGIIQLTAVTGSTSITTGEEFNLSGTWIASAAA